jgi:hypothetical protein
VVQVKPHASGLPLQVGDALAGAVHGVHDVPHELVLLFSEHALPQR